MSGLVAAGNAVGLMDAVAERVAVRMAALLEKRDGASEPDPDESGLAAIYGASITERIASGPNAGRKLKTAGDFHSEPESEERFKNQG